MSPLHIFIAASSIVVIALVISLVFWIKILLKTTGSAHKAGLLFATCFALYTLSQTIIIFQSIGYFTFLGGIPNYGYALAALLFAIGSWHQWKSVR